MQPHDEQRSDCRTSQPMGYPSGSITEPLRIGIVEAVARSASPTVTSPLRHLDAAALADAVRAESRARQLHLPPVSVYRCWATRAETVIGAVIDAVGADAGKDQLVLADPFAGGGVIALAGLIRGHPGVRPGSTHGWPAGWRRCCHSRRQDKTPPTRRSSGSPASVPSGWATPVRPACHHENSR